MSISVEPLRHFLFLAFAFAVSVSTAEGNASRTTKIEWTVQRLSAKPLVIGETTWLSVTQRLLGPTYHLTGDGGDPRQLCYLLRAADGSAVRLVLSFFGSAEGGVLAAIEWQAMTAAQDPWIARVCRSPALGTVGLGIDLGITLGDGRAKLRKILGAPSTTAIKQDDYVQITRHGAVDRSTQLTLRFDARDHLVGLEVRRIETN